MGVVYKARQTRLKRLVALKMILSGAHVAPQELARFRTEAEAVAHLKHPHIIQIYEVGEHAGLPFFSLEFVEGGSLDRRLTGTPLAPRAAARMGEALARAVHHAHEHGVVHRDLKPANVLLARSDPQHGIALGGPAEAAYFEPKITDFGLAKCLDGESSQTHTGAVLGTPSYMAPEQAEGKTKEASPAADIYALGALLYEMLTGRPPFRGETVYDTLAQVKYQEPVPPTRLQGKVPRDLETICLKCLEKEPHKRYASALALADDLQRFLEHQPILARPPGLLGRAGKWARRRPAVAALVVVGLLTLVGFAAGAFKYAVDMRAAAQREEAQRQLAEKSFGQALEAVDKMLSEVAEVELADVPQMEPVRKKLLTKAKDFYEKFLEDRKDDPVVRREAGRAYLRLGDIQEMMNEHGQAEQAYGAAIKLLGDLRAEAPGVADYRRDLARAFNNQGMLFKKNTRVEEAEPAVRRALQLRKELAEEFPDNHDYRRDYEVSRYNLGTLLARLGRRFQEAEDAYRQALAQQERLARSGRVEDQRELARTLNNLGLLLVGADRPEAEKLFRTALEVQQKLVAKANLPGHRYQLARIHGNLGGVLVDKETPQKVEEHYRRMLEILSGLVTDFPRVVDYRQDLAGIHSNLGWLASNGKRAAEAETHLRRALVLREQLAVEFPGVPDHRHKRAETLVKLGIVLQGSGRPGEAERAYRDALAVREDLVTWFPKVPAYRSALGATLNNLALLLFYRGVLSERRQHLELAVGSTLGNPLADLPVVLGARAALLEAKACLHRAARHQRAVLESSPQHPQARRYLFNAVALLADVLVALGDHAAAAAAAEQEAEASPGGYEGYRLAAKHLARSLDLAGKDDRLSSAEREEAADRYGRRAVELLREAVRRGYGSNSKHLEELQTGQFFDPLRGREDFRSLLIELMKRTKVGVG
jgi:tetratricopeptide (TPR) repeat protein